MDAIYFRDASTQYDIKCVDRELLKAYTSFRPLGEGPDYEFGIATGSWGCGAFHGDKYLKGICRLIITKFSFLTYFLAIIQLMAASEAKRPLIYAAYGDKNLVDSFAVMYEYLKAQKATVGHLYQCLQQYFTQIKRVSLFEYIIGELTSRP
jgi:poly(ADP-ribose) glycohydrolase